MDEGLVFNYLTDRKTNLKYYALIPHMVDTFGEDKIVNDLKNNPPDFIFITDNFYPFIGKFGVNYANNIVTYVLNNYDCEKVISHPENNSKLIISVFKKR